MTQQLTAATPVAASRTTGRKPGAASFLWLVWRQHGGLIVSAVVLTLCVCTALLFAGRMLSPVHCTPDPSFINGPLPGSSCSAQLSWNLHLVTTSRWLLRATVLAPLLFGVFWGAPLIAREYETGTHGLAWGQGVTPRHWLRGKLLVLASLAGLMGLAMWLCARPVAVSMSRTRALGSFGWESFSTLAPLTIPYTMAALAVGVLCSVLLKKTLPAMALAAAVCLGLGVATADVLRPHYLTPVAVHYPAAMDRPPILEGSLYLDFNGWADSAGRPTNHFPTQCRPDSDPCLAAHGISGRISVYQPASREGEFQLIEAALTLLLAAGVGSLAIWRVR